MIKTFTRNTNIYKTCKLHRATFSTFYNISGLNFAILLILRAGIIYYYAQTWTLNLFTTVVS